MNYMIGDWGRRRRLPFGLVLLLEFALLKSGGAEQSQSMRARGVQVEGVYVVATLKQGCVSPGDPALLDLATRNDGWKARRMIVAGSFVGGFCLIVEGSDGEPLPLKRSFKPVHGGQFVSLMSGKEISDVCPLTEAYDLSEPGEYRITAILAVVFEDSTRPGMIVSNTAVLRVSTSVSKDFALSSRMDETVIHPGVPVVIHLGLKNVSDRERTVTLGGDLGGYEVTVRDFQGDLVTRKAPTAEGGEVIHRSVGPGMAVDTAVDLSRDYDLTKGPRYFITVMHNVPGDKGTQRQVYSNTVVLTLAP